MIVLPNTDVNGNTVAAGDFLENDRIALKQDHGAAAIYFVADAFTFGDHIRINVYEHKTILGAGGDLAFIENNGVSAVFEDTSVTRGAMTEGFSAEATAREAAVASLTALITALQTRADALEVDPVTKTYVDSQITDLINGAPEQLSISSTKSSPPLKGLTPTCSPIFHDLMVVSPPMKQPASPLMPPH